MLLSLIVGIPTRIKCFSCWNSDGLQYAELLNFEIDEGFHLPHRKIGQTSELQDELHNYPDVGTVLFS